MFIIFVANSQSNLFDMLDFLMTVFLFLVRVICYIVFFSYVAWFIYVSYRIIFKSDENGRLPWL